MQILKLSSGNYLSIWSEWHTWMYMYMYMFIYLQSLNYCLLKNIIHSNSSIHFNNFCFCNKQAQNTYHYWIYINIHPFASTAFIYTNSLSPYYSHSLFLFHISTHTHLHIRSRMYTLSPCLPPSLSFKQSKNRWFDDISIFIKVIWVTQTHWKS